MHASNWPVALQELRTLNEAYVSNPNEAKQQVQDDLQEAAKKVKAKYKNAPDAREEVHAWAAEYEKFPIRSFDLAWTDCKAYVDDGNREKFFAVLPKLEIAGEGVTRHSEI